MGRLRAACFLATVEPPDCWVNDNCTSNRYVRLGRTFMKTISKHVQKFASMAMVLGMVMFASFVVMTIPAHAGADATFAPLVTLITNYMQGSLGLLLALVAATYGLVSAIAGRWGEMFAGFGVGAGFFYVPTILPTIVTGLL
jgi:conjugal transfer pilus assembly protein TraA